MYIYLRGAGQSARSLAETKGAWCSWPRDNRVSFGSGYCRWVPRSTPHASFPAPAALDGVGEGRGSGAEGVGRQGDKGWHGSGGGPRAHLSGARAPLPRAAATRLGRPPRAWPGRAPSSAPARRVGPSVRAAGRLHGRRPSAGGRGVGAAPAGVSGHVSAQRACAGLGHCGVHGGLGAPWLRPGFALAGPRVPPHWPGPSRAGRREAASPYMGARGQDSGCGVVQGGRPQGHSSSEALARGCLDRRGARRIACFHPRDAPEPQPRADWLLGAVGRRGNPSGSLATRAGAEGRARSAVGPLPGAAHRQPTGRGLRSFPPSGLRPRAPQGSSAR